MSKVHSLAKRSEKGLLTPDNCVAAMIDLQPQMLFGVNSHDRQTIINNNLAFAKAARVFHSGDRGRTWTVAETPLLAGIESAGGFSIAFRDASNGVIVGGDYRKPNERTSTGATTHDGGKTWTLIEKPPPFRSGVAWAKNRWVAVGTSGSDISTDEGATWKPLDQENYNTVAFTSAGAGWAAGPKGRIAKFMNAEQ